MAKNENPTTKFKVDISELKAGITEANRLIKLANSEFKAASSGMDNWANSTDGLQAKIKQLTTVQELEQKKLQNLKEQYKQVVAAEGENSKGAQNLAIQINNQEAAVNKVTKELDNYEGRLDLVEKAQKNAEKSGNSLEEELKDLENAAGDAGDAAEESGDGFTIMKGALADLAASAIKSAISAVGDLVGSLLELPEATKEFRSVFSAAMQSASDSAIGIDGAKKSYEEFYKVAADEGQAAEATSHIAGLVSSEKDLQGALDGVIGAWVEFGDSIALEGLAEAAHETATTGKVTGQLADALNWATASTEDWERALGGNEKALSAFKKATDEGMTAEDAYNEALNACSTEQERQQLVVSTLNGLYSENAKSYAESNSSMLDANEANLKLMETQSKMAEVVEPLTAAWTTFKAQALEAITPLIETLGGKIQETVTYLQEHQGVATAIKTAIIGLAAGLGVLATALAIQGAINGVSKAMAFLNTTLLANPIVLIVAAVASLAAGFIYLWNTSDKFREFWTGLWEGIKSACGTAIDAIVNFFTVTVPNAFNAALDWIKNNWGSLLLFLINPFAGLFKYFYENNTKFKEFVDTAVKFIKELPGKIWTWLKNTISKAGTFVVNMKDKAKEAGANFVKNVVEFIKNLPGKIWTWLKNAAQKVVEWKSNLVSKGKAAAKALFDAIVEKIAKLPGKLLTMGKDIVKGLWNGISNMAGWIKSKIEGFGETVLNSLKDFFGIHSPSKVMKNVIGKNLVRGIADGITSNKKIATSVVKKFGKELLSTLETRLENYKTYHKMSLQQETDYWNNARKLFKKGTEERIELDKKYYDAKKTLNEQLETIEKDYTDKVKQAHDDLKSNINSLIESYNNEVTSRANAITSSMSLFSEFKANAEVTGSQLLANLKSQVSGLAQWTKNIATLTARGVDAALISQLEDMGTSAAGEIAALCTLTDAQLDEYVKLWKEKNELAKQQAEIELAPMAEETTKKIAALVSETDKALEEYTNEYINSVKELGTKIKTPLDELKTTMVDNARQTVFNFAETVDEEAQTKENLERFATISQSVVKQSDDLPADFKEIGVNTVQGMIDGLLSMSGTLASTMAGIVSSAVAAAQEAADINSPSRVMRDLIGKNLVRGAIVGIDEEAVNLYRTAKGTIAGAVSSAKAGLQTVAGSSKGGVVNNYTFNQNNTSPKALSRLEIYRQTRNQFRLLKEV